MAHAKGVLDLVDPVQTLDVLRYQLIVILRSRLAVVPISTIWITKVAILFIKQSSHRRRLIKRQRRAILTRAICAVLEIFGIFSGITHLRFSTRVLLVRLPRRAIWRGASVDGGGTYIALLADAIYTSAAPTVCVSTTVFDLHRLAVTDIDGVSGSTCRCTGARVH